MKLIIFILAFLSLSGFASIESVKILRISQPLSTKHRSESVYFLSGNGAELKCETSAVPKHKIKVSGLSVNYLPALKQGPKHCEQVLEWGVNKYCYEQNQDPVVDEMIRQCANL